MRLHKADYLILAALISIGVVVLLGSAEKIQEEIESGLTESVALEAHPNSLAVLPFRNLDINAQTGYFSDGITEEILQRLSTLGLLHVLASNSSFSFRESALPPKEVSRALGVRYLLDGSIRRSDDFVRVTARLLDNNGYQVWSETFDRELTEIFVVQSEIARSVSQEIVNEIVPLQATPAGRTTENMEAYNQYLLGRHTAQTRALDWKSTAETAFNKAIELDSQFAPPYAGLASLVVNTNRGPHWEEALTIADRALELDPQLAEGHAIHGLITAVLGDPAAGSAALQRALELDPSLSMAYNWLYFALERQGRIEESRTIRDRGLEVDPLNPSLVANTADDESVRGEFDRAEQLLLRIASLPEISGPATSILSFYEDWSRFEKLLAMAKQLFVKTSDPDPKIELLYEVARTYARLGMKDEADEWRSRMILAEPGVADNNYFAYYLMKNYDDRAPLMDFLGRVVPIDAGLGIDQYASELGYGALAHINAGNYATGVEWAEKSLGLFLDLYEIDASPGNIDVHSFMRHWPDDLVFELFQHLAFAYQQVGRDDAAAAILHKTGVLLESREVKFPRRIEQRALQSLLLGDLDSAHEYLATAVDAGWANYYEVANDPAWQFALQDERISALLNIAKERVRQQRDNVQTLEEAEDFKAEVERLLGR
jgi:TolB-like protein/tetratricopeptide (TPR) repeat protein